MELSKKHKTFSLIHYHKGIELELIAVTTSKKKFAELLNQSLSYVNNYAMSYDLRYPICNENPEVVYAQVGMGGEGTYIFKRGEIKPIEEYEQLINEHRKKYLTYRDFLAKKDLD